MEKLISNNVYKSFIITKDKYKALIIEEGIKEYEGILLNGNVIQKEYEIIKDEAVKYAINKIVKGLSTNYGRTYDEYIFNLIGLKKDYLDDEEKSQKKFNKYLLNYIRKRIRQKSKIKEDTRLYKGVELEPNIYHSIDMLNIHSRVSSNVCEALINELLNNNNGLYTIRHFSSNRIDQYAHQFDITTYMELYDNEGDYIGKEKAGKIQVFIELRADIGKDKKSVKVEFNPNKVAFNNPVFEIIKYLLLSNERATYVRSFDYATDIIGINIDNLNLRNYGKQNKAVLEGATVDIKSNVSKTGKTYYIGEKPRQIKIYEKLKEIEKNKDYKYYGEFLKDKDKDKWIRIEEGIIGNELFTFENIKKEAPFIVDIPYYKNKKRTFDIITQDKMTRLKALEIIETEEGIIKVKESDKGTIYALVNGFIEFNKLGRKQQDKIKTILNYLEEEEENKKNINIDTGKAFILIQDIIFKLFS